MDKRCLLVRVYFLTDKQKPFVHATLARAWHGKNNLVKARAYLEKAAALMKKTGCYREKDIFSETELLLNESS